MGVNDIERVGKEGRPMNRKKVEKAIECWCDTGNMVCITVCNFNL